MAKLTDASAYKQKLLRKWSNHSLHAAWLNQELDFPYRLVVTRPTDQQFLHHYDDVQNWLAQLEKNITGHGVELIKQPVQYAKMGRQLVPVAIEFSTPESLMRYLGKWQQWQLFCADVQLIRERFPQLTDWLVSNSRLVLQYAGSWGKLLSVCWYMQDNPQPERYIRELDIPQVDSKFIEKHKRILKTLLDTLLPAESVNAEYEKLSEHGFEKRYGLKYPQPQVRFRLLDPDMATVFHGISDLEIPLAQFSRLNLECDCVFITENKTNGLAFPPVKNAIVIFGLGYGIRMLKSVPWLAKKRIVYWGDIDSHGFAILSQVRGYFSQTKSILMNKETLLTCRDSWGEEPESTRCSFDLLPDLTADEQAVYQGIIAHCWGNYLRLEQERIPLSMLQHELQQLSYNKL